MASRVVYRFHFLLEMNTNCNVLDSYLWPSVLYRWDTIKYLCQIHVTCNEIRNRWDQISTIIRVNFGLVAQVIKVSQLQMYANSTFAFCFKMRVGRCKSDSGFWQPNTRGASNGFEASVEADIIQGQKQQ